MIDIETLKEKLALHGYSFKESVNIWEQGETFFFTKQQDNRSITLSCFQQTQSHTFWEFTLLSSVDFFKEDKYLHPILFNEIRGITEEYLKFLPQMEKRLLEINNEQL